MQTATNAAGTVQATSARSQPVTPKPADTSTGLIAHWTMDDTGSTMADSVAGPTTGRSTTSRRACAGLLGHGAFGFNGNGYAYVPQSDELSAVDRTSP